MSTMNKRNYNILRNAENLWNIERKEPQCCTDLTFYCKDGKVQAHRQILRGLSKTMESILSADDINSILLPDLTTKIVKSFLEFLYTGITYLSSLAEFSQMYFFATKDLKMEMDLFTDLTVDSPFLNEPGDVSIRERLYNYMEILTEVMALESEQTFQISDLNSDLELANETKKTKDFGKLSPQKTPVSSQSHSSLKDDSCVVNPDIQSTNVNLTLSTDSGQKSEPENLQRVDSVLSETNLVKEKSATVHIGEKKRTDPVADITASSDHVDEKTSTDHVDEKTSTDHIVGKASTDHIDEKASTDHMDGKASTDHIVGKASTGHVDEKTTTDHIFGKASTDHIVGKASTDHVDGKASTDHIVGKASTDLVNEKTTTDLVNEKMITDSYLREVFPQTIPEVENIDAINFTTEKHSEILKNDLTLAAINYTSDVSDNPNGGDLMIPYEEFSSLSNASKVTKENNNSSEFTNVSSFNFACVDELFAPSMRSNPFFESENKNNFSKIPNAPGFSCARVDMPFPPSRTGSLNSNISSDNLLLLPLSLDTSCLFEDTEMMDLTFDSEFLSQTEEPCIEPATPSSTLFYKVVENWSKKATVLVKNIFIEFVVIALKENPEGMTLQGLIDFTYERFNPALGHSQLENSLEVERATLQALQEGSIKTKQLELNDEEVFILKVPKVCKPRRKRPEEEKIQKLIETLEELTNQLSKPDKIPDVSTARSSRKNREVFIMADIMEGFHIIKSDNGTVVKYQHLGKDKYQIKKIVHRILDGEFENQTKSNWREFSKYVNSLTSSKNIYLNLSGSDYTQQQCFVAVLLHLELAEVNFQNGLIKLKETVFAEWDNFQMSLNEGARLKRAMIRIPRCKIPVFVKRLTTKPKNNNQINCRCGHSVPIYTGRRRGANTHVKTTVMIGGKRRTRCNKCIACKTPPCKVCKYCIIKHLKKPCEKRVCISPVMPKCPCFQKR